MINDYIVYSMDWTIEILNNQLSPQLKDNCGVDDWSLTKKSRFIESLILGLPVPQIVLANREKKNYMILDGCKRIMVIQQFYASDFPLEGLEFIPKFNGLSYEDFAFNEIKDNLDTQPIRITIIKNVSDYDTLLNISQRLNLK